MGAHVVRDREYSPWWDEVVKAVPVGRAGYEALCRSTTPCEGSVGRWTPVTNGLRNILPSGQAMLSPVAPQASVSGSSPESNSVGATVPLQATPGILLVFFVLCSLFLFRKVLPSSGCLPLSFRAPWLLFHMEHTFLSSPPASSLPRFDRNQFWAERRNKTAI